MTTSEIPERTAAARELKHAVMATTAQALASGTRLRMLSVLSQAEQTVDGLAAKVDQSRANTSAQLKVLSAAGLVSSRRAGRHVHYRLASQQVSDLLSALLAAAMAQHAELRELLHTFYQLPESLTRKRAKDLLADMRAGKVLLLDLRPADEYEAEHPEGAVNMPLSELESRMEELPSDREIVAYCRGRFCVFAVEGVELMRAAGRISSNLGASSKDLIAHGMHALQSP